MAIWAQYKCKFRIKKDEQLKFRRKLRYGLQKGDALGIALEQKNWKLTDPQEIHRKRCGVEDYSKKVYTTESEKHLIKMPLLKELLHFKVSGICPHCKLGN